MSQRQETRTGPAIHVAPGPHLHQAGQSTRRMMADVLIGLTPILVVSLVVFRWLAVKQLAVCVGSCLAAEWLFTAMRRKPFSLGDLSAVVTGVVLAFSLPGPAPWHVGAIGGFTAIGLGKIIFGSLGQNIFNPAMVGRAFVMIAFPGLVAAGGYVDAASGTDAVTAATPMTDYYQNAQVAPLGALLLGNVNGSLGETGALACVIGGLYLCIRRTASWEIPAGVVVSAGSIAGILNLFHPGAEWTAAHHLLGGALLFGAFFIATDPVTSPLTSKGKLIFGLGVGALVMILRELSGYPEGVMFSVLIMNSVVPLINRWTVPRPLGGPVPAER